MKDIPWVPAEESNDYDTSKDPVQATVLNHIDISELFEIYTAEELISQKHNNFNKLIPNPWGPAMMYSPQTLWQKALEYFDWNQSHPLFAPKWERGILYAEPRPRAMTEIGFCLFAGISREVFMNYKKGTVGETQHGDQMKIASQLISECIRTQKFEAAAVDLMNANIISRDLGLADKKQIESNLNLGDAPVEFE